MLRPAKAGTRRDLRQFTKKLALNGMKWCPMHYIMETT